MVTIKKVILLCLNVFVSISCFLEKKDGSYRILAGNLEEGINHISDQSRQLVLYFPESWSIGNKHEVDEIWNHANQITGTRKLSIYLDQAESKLFAISTTY